MKISAKKGAAMAYAIIVSTFLFILCAALLPVASGMTDFVRNGTDSRLSYIDAKSSIEYAKAVIASKINNNLPLSSFYVTGVVTADGSIDFAYTEGPPASGETVYATCTYDADLNSITIDANTSRLGYQGNSLTYTTLYVPSEEGGGGPSQNSDYIQVGSTMGKTDLLNPQGHQKEAGIPYIVLFKNTPKISGKGHPDLEAKGFYFYGSPSLSSQGNNNRINLISNVFYFNGAVTCNDGDEVYFTRADTSKPGYIYFKNSVISQNGKSITLNGFYTFTNSFDLLDVISKDISGYMEVVPSADEAKARAQFSDLLFHASSSEIGNLVSGEDAGWTKNGALKYKDVEAQSGKTVFMYVTEIKNINDLMLHYSASKIIIESVGGDLNVGNNKWNTWQLTAEFISLNLNGPVNQENSAKFIIAHPSGSGTVTLCFQRNTKIGANTFMAGTYHCPSGTDLFSPGAPSSLTLVSGGTGGGPTSSEGTSSGGSGGTGGIFSNALYVR